MIDPRPGGTTRRAPQAFEVGDPAVIAEPIEPAPQEVRAGRSSTGVAVDGTATGGSVGAREKRRFGLGWFSVLLASLTALAGLAASIAFARFVSSVLERTDWIGIAGWMLLGLAGLALFIVSMREIVGLLRLGRLASLRRDAEAARRGANTDAERAVVRRLRRALLGREDLAWSLARFAEHERDVRDPGDLFALAEREIVGPLDARARKLILGAAKRVSLVTAMSPIALIAVGFVLVENLRMLRALATLYGGRPGMLGGLKLGRMVFVHILATGGVALTDDLIGQFIGQDLARRLSRRLGEGLFNGALTARIGAAAVDVCRPLPFIEASPVRVRDILTELTRRG